MTSYNLALVMAPNILRPVRIARFLADTLIVVCWPVGAVLQLTSCHCCLGRHIFISFMAITLSVPS